jgi:hypothetical protein
LKEKYKLQTPKTKKLREIGGLNADDIGVTEKTRLLPNEKLGH